MRERACQTVSEERLVAYTDGELSPSEVEQMSEHIAACPHCQALAKALERSLQVTQAIWQTSHVQWPEMQSFDRIRSNGPSFRKVMALAACILLILGASAMWRLLSDPTKRTRTINEEAKLAELRLRIADSGDAARLLAAAELLRRYPETQSGLQQRYRHIAETYPETAAASKARLKTQQFK